MYVQGLIGVRFSNGGNGGLFSSGTLRLQYIFRHPKGTLLQCETGQ